MPLPTYGVLIGTVNRFAREDPQPGQFGKYYHGKIYVNVAGAVYECAVDVATPSGLNIQYSVRNSLDASAFTNISSLADGYHTLATGPQAGPTSGALDYVRSPLLKPPPGCLWFIRTPLTEWLDGLFNEYRAKNFAWIDSDGSNALDVLDNMLTPGNRVFVFGEPYNTGLGMHNIHMNQGDPFVPPPGTSHQHDDGVWQDGGTIVQTAPGQFKAFINKFATQSMNTDNTTGLPI